MGCSSLAALGWSIAFLLHPSLGQMNLAYTYGWHPITLAMPCLLGALVCLTKRQRVAAGGLAILGCAMEEGVIVMVGCWALACAIYSQVYLRALASQSTGGQSRDKDWCQMQLALGGVGTRSWMAVWVLCILAFVTVYWFSGLREFQTARFASLGSSPAEILTSPFAKPAVFWGTLFRPRSLYFLACLAVPCGCVALFRGRRWLLALVLPVLVLLVWDHYPAQSLAFQYATTLHPILWMAAIAGSFRTGKSAALGAVASSMVACVFLGQSLFSSATIDEVLHVSYAMESPWKRQAGSEDGLWLHQQIDQVRVRGGSVLATGRIATHLVGSPELETVGQYLQRQERLHQLESGAEPPLKRYETLILDRLEGFQQTQDETRQVEILAKQAGFSKIEDQYEIAVYRRDPGWRDSR
jgi:uncharacterized membrane protein